jgi:hypothetical protein
MVQHLNEVIMSFRETGYEIIRNFLEPEFVSFIQEYFFVRIKAQQARVGDVQAPFSYSFYGDPLLETILAKSCEPLSKIAGIKLLPQYSFTRLYQEKEELIIHRDRPSCEISATLSLGFPEGEEINSIYFSKNEDKSDATEIKLNPGDLCLYRGCDLYHWRESFKSQWYLQAFLHYVDENGPYADQIYDGRPFLGWLKS